ncbi:mismatch repair endonuclease PMS2 isoform X1 [Pieris brassicae]|uniref:mismatch repair endonuclease PMS2 isoform X1 n=2 Tax=Pieris brassicae TaxID=7116 RepID=UPI001E66143D|nr:mismatch repair endonuclease PMS2 isoform X1 [Pieris brassicae]
MNQENIKPINRDTVHKICSGQVVLSLAVAVKELLENSLDAGATNVDIRLKNYGIDLIEVSDNGSGVTEDNMAALTLKYHTSKLNDYSDLLGVTSFGFRGEALSSLCSLANLTIITRHHTSSYATKIQYDNKGNILSKTPCSRQVGTTVTLTNLFTSLPVRQKEFHKNSKREFNKMTNLLYAYCCISKGVKITCSNQTQSNSKSVVLATTGSQSYKDNIASVFGHKQIQSILEINTENVSNIKENIFKGLSAELKEHNETIEIEDVEIDLSEDSNDADANKTHNDQSDSFSLSQKSQGYKNIPSPVELEGFISSCEHGSGRSSTDRQLYYVNSRPCEPTKIIKLVNEIYKQYNSNQYPFVFLNIIIDRVTVDVNVTPDKRKVFLTKEKAILDVVKASLIKLFENIPSTLKLNSTFSEDHSKVIVPNLSQPRIFNSFMQQFNKNDEGRTNLSEISEKDKSNDLKRKLPSNSDSLIPKIKRIYETDDKNNDNEIPINNELSEESSNNNCPKATLKQDIDYVKVIPSSSETSNNNVQDYKKLSDFLEATSTNKPENKDNLVSKHIIYLESTEKLPATQILTLSNVITKDLHTIYCKTKDPNKETAKEKLQEIKTFDIKKVKTDHNDLGKTSKQFVTFKTSLEQVKCLTEIYNMKSKKQLPERVKFKSRIDPVFNKKCEEELNREISKHSFNEMQVIGQFNLGFIITRLGDDLFIIDQHATDEIYNFETLQKTTELTSQKLVIPQQLELTGVNEEILMDNLDIFKKNGFTFDIEENAPVTKRVKLLTLPMSKNWIFGKDDIEELLFMLKESPSEYCRPSRVRAMFASRACRKSVMIGTALSKADMKQLIDHMSEIDKPWNCPHGRPTIRHLVNLAMVYTC